MDWKDSSELEITLNNLVKRNITRQEILSYLNRDFLDLAKRGSWSLGTLDRALKHFNIHYIDRHIDFAVVKKIIEQEMAGAGSGLGYRAMALKLRQVYDMKVPRDVVYSMMTMIDDKKLKDRQPTTKKKQRDRKFITRGPNFFHSIDGHDKLMG